MAERTARTKKKSGAARVAKVQAKGGRTRSKAGAAKTPTTPVTSNIERVSNRSDVEDVVPTTNGRLMPTIAAEAGAKEAVGLGKYVYCIVQSTRGQSFGEIGLGEKPSEVHTVNYKDLAAVVSDTPLTVHDPTRENVLAHQTVNETVMRNQTVIPMSFGTVFKTRDDIVELLKSAYDAFSDVLQKMRDKVEFGLKVLWDRDAVVKEIEAADEDLRRLRSQIATSKSSAYFARMQYGRLIDAALQARSERYVQDIFGSLRDVSVANRTNRPIGDKMILNAAFLVSREKESAFDARVRGIGARYGELTFKYTGPWPPYNFVNIRLKLERAK